MNPQFVYESEKTSQDADILKEISQGSRLKHVRCNDRSKPNLKGKFLLMQCSGRLIRAFNCFLLQESKALSDNSHRRRKTRKGSVLATMQDFWMRT